MYLYETNIQLSNITKNIPLKLKNKKKKWGITPNHVEKHTKPRMNHL